MSWTLDAAHSHLGFSVRHMMISTVRGQFNKFSGNLELDEQDLTRSRAVAEIEVASIDTGVADRDGHLRSADFFDAAKYPTIRFASRAIARDGDGYRITGDLTMHGVTREVTFDAEVSGPAKDPWGNVRYGVVLTGTIDRKDFGLTWNQALETGGVLVGEKVKVEAALELVKASAQDAAKLAEAEAAAR